MPTKSPKDPDHLKLKLFFIEATAIGRYPITCVFVIALLFMGGLAVGWW